MFAPWIKRSSLKRGSRDKRLLVAGERPSVILLLSLSALLVLVGVFVVQRSWAKGVGPVPAVTQTPTVSPSASVVPSPAR